MEFPTVHRMPTDAVDNCAVVVRFAGRSVALNSLTVPRIRAQLLALAAEPPATPLLLDFANVDYVSSSALGMLVGLYTKLSASGRHLTILNLNPQVYEVFMVTRLDTIIDLRPAEPGPSSERRLHVHEGVLLVDDDTDVLYVLAAALRHHAMNVWLADHGRQALETYQRHQHEIDMVLLDVHMPGLDGPQTLAALQNINAKVRSCFMTGNLGLYAEEDLLQMGALRVFHKPFSVGIVADALTQLMSPRKRRRLERWIEVPEPAPRNSYDSSAVSAQVS